jgi:hypothetical protein
MDIITVIVGGALILYLAYFLVRLAYTIGRNLVNGKRFYQNLESRLEDLRLGRMLSLLGINKKQYVYQNPVNDITKHMNQCASCANTAVCDEKLAAASSSTGSIELDGISFCSNKSELSGLKEQAEKEAA